MANFVWAREIYKEPGEDREELVYQSKGIIFFKE